MKKFMPYLLLFPLLSSCIAQEEYYQPGYYPPPPPPPQVEVHRYNEPRYHGHYPRGNRPMPQARVYHGQPNNQGNAHGHSPSGNHGVVVQPPGRPPIPPQGQPQPQVHTPIHGQQRAVRPSERIPPVKTQQNNVEEHN